jgi:ADP-ribose pyrophosphatase YjhB (NUDIX family)
MPILLLLKSHVKGYTRKDGVFVKEHTNKVVAKPEAPAGTVKHYPVTEDAMAKWKNGMNGAKWTAPKGEATSWKPPKQMMLTGIKKVEPTGVLHPKKDDAGKDFRVYHPSEASDQDTWTSNKKTAIFTPGSTTPEALNGVEFAPWADHPRTVEGWEYVEGQNYELDEPELDTNGKEPAAGVVIEEPDGRVWMVKPSNGFAGYKTTFPKGHADDGISLQATAIKEAFEESGLKVEITGFIGDVERTQTMTRYYRARRVGGTPAEMGWESQAVVLAPKSAVHEELNRDFDRTVASLSGIKAPKNLPESVDDWEQTGNAAGSNPGGFFLDPAGQEWYVKVPKSSNIAKNEILAGKLYEAAGVRVPELKRVTMEGKTAIASKVIPGLAKLSAGHEHVDGVMDGFAVDAWLANWDVVGLMHDNLLSDEHGRAVRVDVGGSLVYRAQGDPKGKHFGDTVNELDSLTNGMNPQAASVFGNITHAELVAGIERVKAVSEAKIKSLCETYGPGDPKQRADLAEKLIKRREDLLSLL